MGGKVRAAAGRKRQAGAKRPPSARRAPSNRPNSAQNDAQTVDRPPPPGAEPPSASPSFCGDYGGVTADGTACERRAGWGRFDPTWLVDQRSGLRIPAGRCIDHDEAAAANVQGLKKRVLDLLLDPRKTLIGACEAIGVSETTLWRWRVADPGFDQLVVESCTARDALRVQLADDAVFGRILTGKAAPGSEIFWLKNKAPQQFRDRQEITGANGTPLMPAQQQSIMFGDVEVAF